MLISNYSTAFNILDKSFDYKSSLDNWAKFSDETVISVNTSTDATYEALEEYGKQKGYNLKLVRTNFDFNNDPMAYGRTENEALQNCSGDILIQTNLDEKLYASNAALDKLGNALLNNPFIQSYFVPTIDLYGSVSRCLPVIKKKWYIHKRGLYRGAVKFGLKSDGRPDYNKTSTDELIDADGNLTKFQDLLPVANFENLQFYFEKGFPLIVHEGYLNLDKNKLNRSLWWKKFWENASMQENTHPTTIEELANKESIQHGITFN